MSPVDLIVVTLPTFANKEIITAKQNLSKQNYNVYKLNHNVYVNLQFSHEIKIQSTTKITLKCVTIKIIMATLRSLAKTAKWLAFLVLTLTTQRC